MKKIKAINREHLQNLITTEIELNGNQCDLNYIDVSGIKNLSFLFSNSKFNGNISEWDVSNVENMSFMFDNSEFNSDISKWNVSNVLDMRCMFFGTPLNQNFDSWLPLKVKTIENIFANTSCNPWWNIEDYEERQSEINKRQLDICMQQQRKKIKIKI